MADMHVHLPIEFSMKSSLYPESYDMNSNLAWNKIKVFINASICTYSHAGNDKGMLQQHRELQLMETVYLTYCNRIWSWVNKSFIKNCVYL